MLLMKMFLSVGGPLSQHGLTGNVSIKYAFSTYPIHF